MNTDIRIEWHSGMEITPQTFIDMENNIAENRLLLRKIMAANAFGIIPRTKFNITHELVDNVLKIKQLICSLLLPYGEVVVIESDREFSVEIPSKEAKELYLTVEVSDNVISFVKADIPHVSNEYKFDFKVLPEIKNAIPLLKIVNENGNWTIYKNYIPPVMSIRTSTALGNIFDGLKPYLRKITEHDKVCLMDGRVYVQVLADQLLSFFPIDESPRELILHCKRLMSALGHALYEPQRQPVESNEPEQKQEVKKFELPVVNLNDVEPFFNAFATFLDNACVAMNDLEEKVIETKKPEEPIVEEFIEELPEI